MFIKNYKSMSIRIFLTLILVIAINGVTPMQANATTHALGDIPGDLDPTFGGTGMVTTPVGSYADEAHAVAIQADGKIVVAGEFANPANRDFFVVRYNNDGSLDTSFDTDGIVTTDFGGDDMVAALAIQQDGRIVILGFTSPEGGIADFALARYNTNGSLDTSFDSDGKLITDLGSGYEFPSAIAIQSDDKIVVVGGKYVEIAGSDIHNDSDIAVVRYNSNGVLDTTFDADGILTTSVGSGIDFGNSVAVQSDGKIVVGGFTSDIANNTDFALLRYNDDGSLDTSFDVDGIVTTDFGIGMSYEGGYIALQPDGKIIIAGNSDNGYFLLARYDDNGSLDTSFSTDGLVATPVNRDHFDNICDIVLQQDGKIVIAGSSGVDYDFAVARYNIDGSQDWGFGTGGMIFTDFGNDQDDLGNSVAIQADGKIVVAGGRYISGSNYDVAVARYLGGNGTQTRYVKWNATGENNGTSWTDAYTDLQSALAVANSGDQIWVAAGTYKPTTDADRTISFTLKNNVAVYGGFAGDDTIIARDPATYVTVLSGDIGVAGINTDNSYHVVIGSNTNSATVLDGFTITSGNASGNGVNSSTYNGGGIYNILGNPTIQNVVFTNNSAMYGGGMYSEGFDPGGIAQPTLTNVTFINNTGMGEGGGMENRDYSQPSLTNVAFIGNSSNRSGGGMLNLNHCDSVLMNVTFSNNTAVLSGGGMDNIASNSTLTNVTFSNNSSAEWGGGMDNAGNSTTTLINVTFTGNTALTFGGAISNQYDSNLTLTNVTINGNSAVTDGDGVYNESGSSVDIRNSILYGNGEEINGTAVVTYSIVQGGYSGTGNLDADPLLGPMQNNGGFTQTMALLAGSPAIDAGSDAICPVSDQRGASRSRGLHCDMGAYEFGSSLPTFEWNTFQGGSLKDYASDVAIDQLGNIYITGNSDSARWEGNPINPFAGGIDAFVAKFDPGGHLLWYTFLGSSRLYYGNDVSNGIVLDESGNIYIHGESTSAWGDDPISGFIGGLDVFVAKLNPSGDLLWHTFLGGSEADYAGGIDLSANGDIYIVGTSYGNWEDTISSPIHPFSGEYPLSDAFVAKLSPSGVLQWQTFLGGTDFDYGNKIDFEGNGNIYIAGESDATWGDSPIHNFSGDGDAFVAKISSAGELLWNTFLGGPANDMATGLTTDASGEVLVAGGSSSSWGINPIHPYSGFGDGFLAKLDADGMVEWNTFFGGAAFDHAADVVINDADHTLMVIGFSEVEWGNSPEFPYNTDGKSFLAQFQSDGALQWNSFLGQNYVWGAMSASLAIRDGNIIAAGWSANPWGTPIHAYNADSDVYVLKVKVDNTPPVATQSIPLSAGWNLVSFKIKPTDTNISSVLSSIEGNYDLVYTWDATGAHAGSGNWLKADNVPASPDSLTVLNEAMGFWVHMTSVDTLQVTGTASQTTNIPLLDNAGGWNLVSYPSSVNGTLPGILTDHGVGTDFSLVYAYHPEDVGDPWKIFDTTAPLFVNDLTQLVSGLGYWVKVNADHTWVVGYGAP